MVQSTTPPISPHVAVVTVSYHSEDVLPQFLSSLTDASEQACEVLIADNSQGEDAVGAIARAHRARHLRLAENLGYGGAVNAAVQALAPSVEWVLVSNPDVALRAGALDILLATASEDPLIAAVGPTILTAEGEPYPSARAVPSLRTGIGHALFMNLWVDNPWSRAYRHDTEGDAQVRRDAGWLSGACLLVRRSAFEEIGGFDDGYFMYFEDVDLGYRLGKAGYRNVFEPRAVVTHTGAHSTAAESSRMIRAHHDSARRFLNKKYSGWLLWPVRFALTVGLSLRSWLVSRERSH